MKYEISVLAQLDPPNGPMVLVDRCSLEAASLPKMAAKYAGLADEMSGASDVIDGWEKAASEARRHGGAHKPLLTVAKLIIAGDKLADRLR